MTGFLEDILIRHMTPPRYRGIEIILDHVAKERWVVNTRTGRKARIDSKTWYLIFEQSCEGRSAMMALVNQITDPWPERVDVWLGV